MDPRNLLAGTPWRPFALALVAGLVVTTAEGRVFRRWRATAAAVRVLEEAGGRQAYVAPVSINGRNGRVTVLGFNASLPDVMRSTASRFGTAPADDEADTLAVRHVDSDDGSLDLVAAEVEPDSTVVFVLEQDADGQGGPRFPEGLPAFPGAAASFSARDRRARLQFCTATTAAMPAAVQAYYRHELTGGGWTPVAHGAKRSGLDVYLKPGRVCCVYAATRGRFALMQKEVDLPPQ